MKESTLKNNKIEENKAEKENKLLEVSFDLFTEKGIRDTSVQEITDKAGLAKGTFYLYFKDKYELQNKLIIRASKTLFDNALKKLERNNIKQFDDGLIFVIDYIINELNKNRLLLKFISKNLSWGLYYDKVTTLANDEAIGVRQTFIKGMKEMNVKLDNPDVTLYMIIELVGSTCFSSILNKEPLPINEYKPYLYDAIRKLLNK